MESPIVFDPLLTKQDFLLLRNLTADFQECRDQVGSSTIRERRHDQDISNKSGTDGVACSSHALVDGTSRLDDEATIAALRAVNDPKDDRFEPTVFNNVDLDKVNIPQAILQPYIRIARSIVRVDTDVVMFTHLLLYFTTSIPSALFLFWRFTWIHGILHFLMQFSYMGTYTLMMHQHIHMHGILKKRFGLSLFDRIFPYITDPLMGHTWNSYFYHHVKHHHVEGNGPDDLSSTIRYQRDDVFHFLHYTGRFLLFIWFELPLYFLRKGRIAFAAKCAFWDISNYLFLYFMFRFSPRPTFFAMLLPFILMRIGLMVGNWGQHAFVDYDEPDSDYRSSITLIDVASNRYCFNDGYHTSHHLNPLRHWREHPVSFLKSKSEYTSQHALVFYNIDYLMITVRLLLKDYEHLARCMVPLGNQRAMTMEERAKYLRRHTQRFTEEDIKKKFKKA